MVNPLNQIMVVVQTQLAEGYIGSQIYVWLKHLRSHQLRSTRVCSYQVSIFLRLKLEYSEWVSACISVCSENIYHYIFHHSGHLCSFLTTLITRSWHNTVLCKKPQRNSKHLHNEHRSIINRAIDHSSCTKDKILSIHKNP